MGLLDGIFLGGLSFLTGGFESIAYWIFPALIVLNAISIPLAAPQIVLNLLLSLFYLGAGVLTNNAPMPELSTPPLKAAHLPAGEASSNHGNKPFLVTELPYMTTVEPVPMGSIYPRLFVLWLLTACCYGLQLLVVRQQEAMEEAREFALREGQLRSAGRLAAEFAHQIKNPLAVINSTAFSLQRSLGENANEAARKIHIIQEEVERADRVITQIMGYAQLTEGRVERLNVIEEVDRAIARIFPPALPSRIKIHREYARDLPPLLMQRIHLSDILLNLLKNAREALGDAGKVFIAVRHREDNSVEVSIRDEGPGIAADKMTRIFESYYTTKEKGTGLGLSIVKRNVELYGGAIRAKSEIGKGAEFILTFPAKATASLSPQTKET
ncbi:MAG: GHKL domain-containing protein, partial [Verrucomicrobia bacterium]|nr:GHKL domain-containing protein [Verrucomicrobiota bacterium]